MLVLKKRHLIAGALILSVIFSAVFFSGKKEIAGNDKRDGEAVYVEQNNRQSSAENVSKEADQTSETNSNSNTKTASNSANDFFILTKMERENSKSRQEEILKTLTKDSSISSSAKEQLYEKLNSLINKAQTESKIEALIKEKGFSDAVALIGQDGSIDIVIKTQNLTDVDVAKIVDVASRQANIEVAKIHIKNVN